MTLLDNYKPREKKEIIGQCLGCIIMKKTIKKYGELELKMEKCRVTQRETIALMTEIKNFQKELIILQEKDIKLMEEQTGTLELNTVFLEEFCKNRGKIREKKDEIGELEKKVNEKKKEMLLLFNEIDDEEKTIEKYKEKYNLMKKKC